MDIGIDLGTTFSVIAVPGRVALAEGYPEGEYLEECDVTVIPSPDGNPTFPSVILDDPEDPERYIVGMEAKQAAEDGAAPIMWSKRKIGTTEDLRLGEKTMTAKDAAALILGHLKDCAERALGQPVRRAVVTHPAYFDPNQVAETKEAAEKAGFSMESPEQLLMEPVAAALAYVRSDPQDPLQIMTYDLGGGTFDVAVLERNQGVIDMKAYGGDHLLGGYNFDRALAQWVLDRQKEKGRNIVFDENSPEGRGRWAQLLQWAEQVKERLSNMGTRRKVKVQVTCNFLRDDQGKAVQVREQISMEDFAEIIKDDLAETVRCCRSALGMAGIQPDGLHYILLVGGSTYGPWTVDALRAAFPGASEPLQFSPDLCVAAGAAIRTAELPKVGGSPDLQITLDVSDHSLLREISVCGRVKANERPLPEGACATLRTPGGQVGPAEIAPNGAFVFDGVVLEEEGPTEFHVEIIAANGTKLAEHPFAVTYSPERGDVTHVVTVLPKPLYVRTAKGMRPLAQEGIALPSEKTEIEMERLFGDDTLSIEIHQEGRLVGTVTVTDIPPSAGEGAKVKLAVQVTEHNEIKGDATVYARSGDVAASCPVLVKFPPSPVPPLSELRAKFQSLEDERNNQIVFEENPERKTLLVGRGAALAAKIRKALGNQQPDRQELEQMIRDFERVVNPPPDEMEPSRAEFDGLLQQCRDLLNTQSGDPQKTAAFANVVDRCEREGKEAYARKDERKWNAVFASLAATRHQMQPKTEGPAVPPPPTPPTPVLKNQMLMEVSQTRAALSEVRDQLQMKNPARYAAVTKSRCDQLEPQIKTVEKNVHDIPDDMDENQAKAKVQLAVMQIRKIQQAIANIETDTDTR